MDNNKKRDCNDKLLSHYQDNSEIRDFITLSGEIAHDLNTILTTIFGYSEMALESAGNSSETGQYVHQIIEAAEKARMLTCRLLDISHPSSGEKTRVKVNDILYETVEFIRPLLKDSIRLEQNTLTTDIYVMAVPLQLFRIFLNISVNAIQSMAESGGTLTITLDKYNNGGKEADNFALIRFEDTGKGMDKETGKAIFTPYYSSGGKKHSTGLGLTIVRELTDDIHGKLKVRSSQGRGTAIDVLIPLAGFGPLNEKH